MDYGTTLLGREDVMDGVAEMVTEVQVEATFPDGKSVLKKVLREAVSRSKCKLKVVIQVQVVVVSDFQEIGVHKRLEVYIIVTLTNCQSRVERLACSTKISRGELCDVAEVVEDVAGFDRALRYKV